MAALVDIRRFDGHGSFKLANQLQNQAFAAQQSLRSEALALAVAYCLFGLKYGRKIRHVKLVPL